MDLTPEERRKMIISTCDAPRRALRSFYRKFAIVLFLGITGFILYVFPSVHDPQVRFLLIALIFVAGFGLLVAVRMRPSDIRPWNVAEGNDGLMNKIGVDSASRALFKKLGVPEKTIVTTRTYTTPLVVQKVTELPPELADYPGVQKLFEEAQNERIGSRSGRLDASSANTSEEQLKTRAIHDVSELPPVLAQNPEIRKLIEQAHGSAVLYSSERVVDAAGALKDPRIQELLKNREILKPGIPAKISALRVELPAGTADARKVQEITQRAQAGQISPKADSGPVHRASNAFNWIVLILLCLGLGFAITAFITLFSNHHVLH